MEICSINQQARQGLLSPVRCYDGHDRNRQPPPKPRLNGTAEQMAQRPAQGAVVLVKSGCSLPSKPSTSLPEMPGAAPAARPCANEPGGSSVDSFEHELLSPHSGPRRQILTTD